MKSQYTKIDDSEMEMCFLLFGFVLLFIFLFFNDVNLRLFICKKFAANITVNEVFTHLTINEVFTHFTINGPEVSD